MASIQTHFQTKLSVLVINPTFNCFLIFTYYTVEHIENYLPFSPPKHMAPYTLYKTNIRHLEHHTS